MQLTHLSITPIHNTRWIFLHDERRRREHAIAGHNRARRTVGGSTATTEGRHTQIGCSDTNESFCRTAVRIYVLGCRDWCVSCPAPRDQNSSDIFLAASLGIPGILRQVRRAPSWANLTYSHGETTRSPHIQLPSCSSISSELPQS